MIVESEWIAGLDESEVNSVITNGGSQFHKQAA